MTRTTSPVPPVPPARGALPYLTVQGASDAIAWYQRIFGAEVLIRLDDPQGQVLHSELKVGPASFMMTEERLQMGARGPKTVGGTSVTVTMYVPDADAVIRRALEAGAQPTMPLMDQFWGDRAGGIVDPFGHQWIIATHREEPSIDELKQRLQAMFEHNPSGSCG